MRGSALFGGGANPAWRPSDADRRRSRLLTAMRGWGVESIETLHRRSVDDPEWFWTAATADLGVEFSTPFERVRDESDGVPFPKWFTGGRINAATLCSHRHAAGDLAGKTAVVYEGDAGQRRSVTFGELDAQVRALAANLAARGIAEGDRVVLYVPVAPESVVAFLACAAIGAISVPAFTGFGAAALHARIEDSGAVAVITADGTTRRGSPVPLKPVVDEALAATGDRSVRLVLVLNHNGEPVEMTAGRDLWWHDLEPDPAPVETVQLDPNAPLSIVYTSGTTGRPKGIVHSHGGFAVKAATDFGYGFDVHADDTIGWITDMGWLVGPLMIMGGLQLGATIVLIEGVPTYPTPSRMWEIIERNGVTMQGIAPTAARAILAAGGDIPAMPTLRAFASTGEAWDEPTWRWLFETVGRQRAPIMNYSGGTEIGGGIMTSYPFLPISASGFNGPLPGMDVAVLDDDGRPVTGQIGELAVLSTWPGMTHAFWQDRERYLDTYWSRFDGAWVHGDLASVDDDGYWQIHGRSDDTIKVSGRRIGPAEIEAALLRDRRIVEAAAIGVPDERRGQRITAFVTVADPGVDIGELTAAARENVGASFAPDLVIVDSLPKTKNGKIMRRAIRARHLGTPTGDMSSLDPATPLEHIPPLAGEQ